MIYFIVIAMCVAGSASALGAAGKLYFAVKREHIVDASISLFGWSFLFFVSAALIEIFAHWTGAIE